MTTDEQTLEQKTRFAEQTYYIKFIIVFTIANILAVFTLITVNGVLSALGYKFLDNTILIALIGFLGVNVLGVFIAMMNDLFNINKGE